MTISSVSLSILLTALLLAAVPASAQDVPGGKFFIGFSYVDEETGGTFTGGQGSYSFTVSDALSLKADFGGQFGTVGGLIDVQTYEFLFGPEFTKRGKKASFFVHGMAGMALFKTSSFTMDFFGTPITVPGTSTSGLALGIGGGVDVAVGKNWTIRVIQLDVIPARLGGGWSTNSRFGFGVAFNLGAAN